MACRFNFFLERELWNLHTELAQGSYQPGPYRHFTIYEPKKRLISAAPYRDRVVHHAIHNVLEGVFEPTLEHGLPDPFPWSRRRRDRRAQDPVGYS